jgi:hypothetical protein
MDRTIANFGGPEGTWTDVQIEDAKEFWTAHCTTELVRMAAMVCLQPSATSLNARSSKTSLITLLVAAEVQCCSPYILEKLYASMGSGLQASAAGGASAGEGAGQVRQSSPIATPAHTPARIADVGTPQRASTGPEAPKPAEQPGSTESVILAALLKLVNAGQVVAKGNGHGGSPDLKTEVVQGDRFESWLKKIHGMIRAFKFVDPSLLAPEHLRKMREKWQGRRALVPKVIQFGAEASFSTGVEEEVLVHEGCSLREFIQGFDAGLLVLVQCGGSEALALMADRLSWRSAIASYDGLSPDEQLLYMREFMFKYQGEANSRDWTGKFTSDIQLLLAVTRRAASRTRAHGNGDGASSRAPRGESRRYQGPSEARGFGGRKRGRDDDNAERRLPRHTKGRRSRSPRRQLSRSPARSSASSPDRPREAPKAGRGLCKSRLSGTKCKFQKCRFSHVCPCCATDHEGAATGCSTWNADVAKRAAEALNLKP